MESPSDRYALYTVGHSNLEWPAFVELLRQFRVELLIDVRSRPRSMRHPQFSQPEMEIALREARIRYLFLGEELGGRPEDPKAYRADGMVDYRARRKSYGFQAGIERVLMEAEKCVAGLLCAEEDPMACHRFLMICPELVRAGVWPLHIRKGGVVETQLTVEDRLLEEHHFGDVTSASLFPADRAVALEDAYIAQAEKCAFRADPAVVDYW